MTILNTISTLAVAQVFIAMSPGPNTVLVIQNAMRSRKLGFATALGIFPAGIFWAAAGLLGLNVLLTAWSVLATAMYAICGAYLMWLGLRSMRNAFLNKKSITQQTPDGHVSLSQAFKAGAITNITNPKTVAYYTSIFAATGAFALQGMYQVIPIIMMPAISFLWFTVLIMLVSHPILRRIFEKSWHWVDGIAGLIMIGLGAELLILMLR